jgi:hypothetical protein
MHARHIKSLAWYAAVLMMLDAAVVVVAQPISITNPGFETNTVAPNCFQVFIPTGWSVYDPNGIWDNGNDSIGGLHPLRGGPWFVDGAPEGQHVGLAFIGSQTGQGPMGYSQTLGEVLNADHYTLTVQIGNIASGTGPFPCNQFGFFDLDGFPGYRVQMLAGGVVVAEDNNSLAGTIADGHWAMSTSQVTIPVGHPQLGQLLQIRLINLNMIETPAHPGIKVDFDDVRLVRGGPQTGDLDNDNDVDGGDAAILVDVLLEIDADPNHVAQSDLNCSGSRDGVDVGAFINLMIN